METDNIIKKFLEFLSEKNLVDPEKLASFKNEEVLLKDIENINNIFECLERERITRWISDNIRVSLDLGDIFKTTVEEVGKLLKVDRCLLAIFNKETLKFESKSEYRINEEIPLITGSELLINATPEYYKKIVNDQIPIIFNDIESEALTNIEVANFYSKHKSKSSIIVPIVHKGEILGAFSVHQVSYQRTWQEHHIELLTGIGNQVALAVKQAELFDTTKKQAERETLLRKITETIRSSLDINETLKVICQEIAYLFEVERITIIEFPDKQDYQSWMKRAEYKSNKNEFFSKDLYFEGQTSTFWAEGIVKKGTCIAINDINTFSAPDYVLENLNLMGIKSIIGIPIRKESDIWGFLSLTEYSKARYWSKEEINLLETLAGQIYIAINQAELFSATKKHAEREALLRRITETIRSSLDISEVKRIFVNEVGEAFGADRCFIGMYDFDNSAFHPIEECAEYLSSPTVKSAVGYTFYDEMNEYFTSFHRHDLSTSLSDTEKLIKGDFSTNEGLLKLYLDYDVKSNYGFSIKDKDQALGAFILHYTNKVVVLTEDDHELLKTIANQMGIALKQAELFTITKKQAEREALLRKTIETLRSSLDINIIKKSLVAEAGKEFNADRCFIRFFDETKDDFVPIDEDSEYLSSPDIQSTVGSMFDEKFNKFAKASHKTKKGLILPDIEVLIKENAFPESNLNVITEKYGVKSSYGFAIYNDNRLIAIFVLQYIKNKKELSEEEINLLRSITDQTGIAIKQAELLILTKKQAEREALLRKIIETTRSSLDIDEVLHTICRELFHLFKVNKVALSKYSEFKGIPFWTFLVEYQTKLLPLLRNVNSSIKTSSFFAKCIYDEEKNIIIDNMDKSDYPLFFRKIYQNLSIKSLLAVPIKKGNEKWGAIGLLQSDNSRKWTQDEINLLTTIADNISIAIKQAELYSLTKQQAEKEKEKAERERKLRDIISKIRRSLNVDETLAIACQETASLFNLGRISIFHYPEKNNYQKFVLMHEYKAREDIKGIQYSSYDNKVGEFIAETLFENSNTLAIEDIFKFDSPDYFQKFYRSLEARSLMVAPIKHCDDIWGMIALTEYNYFRKWTQEEIRLLETIAHQIYMAVNQSELFSKIQQATRLKSEFLANMSHEFRTPLNAIIGFSEMINKGYYGELSDKGMEYLNNISVSGKHLLGLVNNILDLSKIESGNANMTYEKFNTSHLIRETITVLENMAKRKNISIELDLGNIMLNADMGKFRQIMYNLVSNSVKFTPEDGKVIISSKLEENKIRVSIQDTGIGIARKDYAKIFAEFSQVDSSYVRKQEGTGLGLVLTKKLVELHEGQLYFESEEGKGSKFTFTLPHAEKII